MTSPSASSTSARHAAAHPHPCRGHEAVQRADASFVLYRIYQDMFRRGRQERLTQALFFAEGQRFPAAVRLAQVVA